MTKLPSDLTLREHLRSIAKARWAKLSKEERSEIQRQRVQKRWDRAPKLKWLKIKNKRTNPNPID